MPASAGVAPSLDLRATAVQSARWREAGLVDSLVRRHGSDRYKPICLEYRTFFGTTHEASQLKGSGNCGAITYEVDQRDMPIGRCHCTNSRKAHAAAYASNAGVLRERLRWRSGPSMLSSYESSPSKLRHFCSKCGLHLIAERPIQRHVIVRAATLDDGPAQGPRMHVRVSKAVPRLVDWPGTPMYESWQPDGKRNAYRSAGHRPYPVVTTTRVPQRESRNCTAWLAPPHDQPHHHLHSRRRKPPHRAGRARPIRDAGSH